MNKSIKKIILIISIVFASLMLAFAGYVIYKVFINPQIEVEIEGYNPNVELPKDAPRNSLIDNKYITKILKSNKHDGYYVQIWSMNRSCSGTIDTNLINNLKRNYPKIKIILISIDLNAKNMDKALSLFLYDNKIKIDTYLLDYPFSFLDLKNEKNILKFLQFLTKRKDDNLQKYGMGFFFNKNGKLLYEFNDITNNEILQKVDKYFKKLIKDEQY